MTQSFECPNCQATLDFNPQSNPVTVRCSFCNSTVIVPETLRPRSGPRNQQSSLAEIVELVQNGRKIDAIKLFCETFGVGLKDAKDVVDAIERHEDIHLGGTSFHTGAMSVTSYTTTTPMVQTSSGRSGCAILVVILVIIAIAGAGVLFFIPLGTSSIVEEIRNVTNTQTENNTDSTFVQPELPNIGATLEAALPQQAIETNDSGFADVVLEIGGEEGTGPGFFNDTRRLGTDGQGNIYTGDYSGGRIQVFDASGKFLATWNAGEDLYMTGMTADRNGTVYILKSGEVEKYNGLTGEFLGTVSLPGGQTRFETATTGPDGSVYLVGEDRLVRLDSSGNIALDLAQPFANVPDYNTTYNDAAVDGEGNIYVLGDETVYKLSAQGQFLDQIGSKGEAEDQFYTSPTAIAVDGKGRIFVNDFWGIKVFEGNGRYLTTIESPGVIFDMLFTDENDLLAMDRNSNAVVKYQLNQ